MELDVGHPLLVVPPGTGGVLVDRPEIRIEVRDEPGTASGRATCRYALEDGRFLEIQAQANRMEPSFSPAWFTTFGRPDDAITAREVEFLERVLPRPPATVLDVPCGFGRHAHALAALGYAVTGVERASAVAAEARAGGIKVHELDLRRLHELPGRFEAVICMWASFGWYDDATNAAVFAAMAAKATHTFVLDVYDPSFFREHQGISDNRGVRDEKRVEGDRLLTSLDYPDGTRDEFEWRLYEPEELAKLGREAGLHLQRAEGAGTPRRQLVFERA